MRGIGFIMYGLMGISIIGFCANLYEYICTGAFIIDTLVYAMFSITIICILKLLKDEERKHY